MIRNLVFDFGGVLVDYDYEKFFATVMGSEEQARQFMSRVFTRDVVQEVDRESIPFDRYISDMKQQWPDYAHVFDEFDRRYTDLFTNEVPGMRQLIHSLHRRGYPILGLSNWSQKVNDVIAKFPEIFSLIDDSLISYQVHLVKPEPAIYEAFFRKFHVVPSECLFIDDKPENVAAARLAGMESVVFHDAGRLSADLDRLLQPD